ncbi:glycosyltransferase family 4 protein [Gaetbulibacter sp. PBL-D1]|uniref:glycosyltransferase family 4 protein n=1 Tax=Gaetbulibacter sp. PBL-D1 TaxID=3422594 RepID=UPI003D2F21E5
MFKKPSGYVRDCMLRTSFKQQGVDVVLVEYGTQAHNLRGVLASLGLPVVVHFHGYDASRQDVIARCDAYREVFQLASKVIAVSRVMETTLLKLGCPKAKLVYNVYGPQPEFETINPTFAKKQLIGIGRFTDKKAPYYTLMAFKEVVHKHPDARLLLAGDGTLLNVCKNLVKHYGLEKQVVFLDVITPQTYRNLLSESLAFVQHSITADNGDMEGTPLAVLEASAAGLPVISTYHAGIPDVVVHGETGLLCEEHDVKAMTQNMLRLLDDVDYAQQLGRAGQERVNRFFTLERHIGVLQALLEEVAD